MARASLQSSFPVPSRRSDKNIIPRQAAIAYCTFREKIILKQGRRSLGVRSSIPLVSWLNGGNIPRSVAIQTSAMIQWTIYDFLPFNHLSGEGTAPWYVPKDLIVRCKHHILSLSGPSFTTPSRLHHIYVWFTHAHL